jgi:putative ABC transport system permease protein
VALQELRDAFRSLRHAPGFTIVASTCLALGIGVNTMIFSVVNGVLMEPLPFEDPDRLVIINEAHPPSGIRFAGASYLDLRDWRERSRSFATIAGVQMRSLAVADRGDPERYDGAAISWDLFSTLGVVPILGRDFVPADDRSGAEPVVLLSEELWRVRYSADRSIVGRSISVNGRPHTVIGVMPENFEFPMFQKLWVPLTPMVENEPRDQRSLMAVARLAPGVSIEQAHEELAMVAAGLAREFPGTNDRWTTVVQPLADEFMPEDVRLVLLTMMGAVTLVLVVACANVANLMLARATARRREIGIRASLGAGRLRIARQMLSESVLLALVAVPPGIALAYAGNQLIWRAIPPNDIPYLIDWSINTTVLLYTAGVAVITGIVFGLAPTLQTLRLNLSETLKEGGRGTAGTGARAWLRNGLVVCEIAVSLVLLVGASLFMRSFWNVRAADVGFDTAPLMTVRVYMTGDAYATEESRAQRVEEIVSRIESLPGVEAAFASNLIPLDGGGGGGRLEIPGRESRPDEAPYVGFNAVTPHMLETLGITVMRGRTFTDAEGQQRTPVAIVNDRMAERFWPGEDPVGRQFRVITPAQSAADTFTIIGVVREFLHDEVADTDDIYPQAYVPYPYAPTPNTGVTIRVASQDPASITAAVREEIRRIDPGLPIFAARTMDEVKRLGSWQFGLFGWLFSAFGAVALLLAATGVYGLLSWAVSQRTQEIGVRMALGADRRDVMRMVVGHGLRLSAAGIAIGLIASFAVSRVIRSMLFNVSPTDVVSFAGAAIFLVVIAMAASYLPTRRATAVDPVVALRA